MAHHLSRPHRLGPFGEDRAGSKPRDAVAIGPQQLPHRGEIAAAQPPALGIGRHPPLDPAEHYRALRLGTEKSASAAETGSLDMGEQMTRRH